MVTLCYYIQVDGERTETTIINIRVWRSLVSRLNGVQEAAGSNPVTRTKKTRNSDVSGLFLLGELQ